MNVEFGVSQVSSGMFFSSTQPKFQPEFPFSDRCIGSYGKVVLGNSPLWNVAFPHPDPSDTKLMAISRQVVHVLYQENDWVYVISEDNKEGFIPHSYCAQYGSQLGALAFRKKLPR